MALHLGGLPMPSIQHPVSAGGRSYQLDVAYPAAMLALEYDGADHRTQERARRDLLREAALTAIGWKVLRFDAAVVMNQPLRIAAQTRHELSRRGS